jgi:hypothetical protein
MFEIHKKEGFRGFRKITDNDAALILRAPRKQWEQEWNPPSDTTVTKQAEQKIKAHLEEFARTSSDFQDMLESDRVSILEPIIRTLLYDVDKSQNFRVTLFNVTLTVIDAV